MNERTNRVLSRVVVVLAVAGPVGAQHIEIAANGDGSVVYVASYSVLRGATPTRPQTRVYRIAADGAQLFAQRATASPDETSPLDGIASLQISADGSLVAFTEFNVCITTNPCVIGELSHVRGAHSRELGTGLVQMTQNGRWVLTSPPRGSGKRSSVLFDLNTGQDTSIPSEMLHTPVGVSSDGSIFGYQDFSTFGVWRAGQFSAIAVPNAGVTQFPQAVSDDGRTFVYVEVELTPQYVPIFRLVALDTVSSHATILFDQFPQSPTYMATTADGRFVLFSVTDGAARIADSTSGQYRILPLPDGEQATAGAFSGDGVFAFLATDAGRILRLNLADQTVETLIPATPDAGRATSLTPHPLAGNVFTPGSLSRLQGTIPGSSNDLQGHILLNGQPVPIVSAESGHVAIQAPWELSPGEVPFTLDIPGDSPFVDSELVKISPLGPMFEPPSSGNGFRVVTLIKGDLSGPVTEQPKAGDIVHTYMIGLGPVQGNPETGVPTPSYVPMPLSGTINCTLFSPRRDLTTVSAGLAPGLIGIYRITLQWPENGPFSALACGITTPDASASAFAILPFAPFLSSP